MPAATSRTARIEARIAPESLAPESLAIIRRAAELQGRSVSDFVVAAAQDAATKAIEQTQIILLSMEDRIAFAEAILNPPPPNAALMRAAEAHRRLIHGAE